MPDLLGPAKLPGSYKSSLLAYGLKALPGPPILGELGPLFPPSLTIEGTSKWLLAAEEGLFDEELTGEMIPCSSKGN